jgi:formylglycine-generating enzyme
MHHALCVSTLCACLVTMCAPSQVLSAVVIDWVTVGNPGNPADPRQTVDLTSGHGSVGYLYRIGKFEVTNGQYVEFLNAKDPAGGNALALYNSDMNSNANGSIQFNSGAAVGAKYVVKSGRANTAVNFVSWYDAVRFVNWLNNGQGTGDTETGAYTLGTLGAGAVPINPPAAHDPGAKIWLPTENEWRKAAYYNAASAQYVDYPTGTNSPPISIRPDVGSNAANYFNDDGIVNGFNNGYAVTNSAAFNSTENYVTDVGDYDNSPSLYGTFDQGGNLKEWTETLTTGTSRVYLGGSWGNDLSSMHAAFRASVPANTNESHLTGFRIASVPEPQTATLVLWAAVLLAKWRRRSQISN